jgi:hypothetical protein
MRSASSSRRPTRLDSQEIAAVRRRLEMLARVMDSAVRVPGTDFRFGADAALNIVPGIGTAFAKVVSAYLIWEARRLGVPARTLAKMVGHVGIDFAISIVPLIGWVGDAFYKSNLRNMALLRAHLDGLDGIVEVTPDPVVRRTAMA